MKSLGKFLFVAVLVLQSSAWAWPSNYSEIENPCSKLQPTKGDDYWPWSLAIPFPWKDIQGIWKAEYENGATSYFSFTIVRRENEVKQLRVVQYLDLSSCEVISRGVGREFDKQINAQMNSKNNMTFRILMAAFDAKSLPSNELSCSGPVMAMSLIPFGHGFLNRTYNMPLFKVANRTTCRPSSLR